MDSLNDFFIGTILVLLNSLKVRISLMFACSWFICNGPHYDACMIFITMNELLNGCFVFLQQCWRIITAMKANENFKLTNEPKKKQGIYLLCINAWTFVNDHDAMLIGKLH